MRARVTTVFLMVITAVLLLSSAALAQGRAMTTVCENPGGNEPQGQCQGEALEEETRNPAGHAPPGQQ